MWSLTLEKTFTINAVMQRAQMLSITGSKGANSAK